MACHEIAALRLGMMNILGIDDEAEREHELAELGSIANEAGPLQNLQQAKDWKILRQSYTDSIAQLEDQVAQMAENHPKLAYYRSLLILNRKVEMELRSMNQQMEQLYRDLEDTHDYLHEVYPIRNT
ncbi:MAG: DUF3209 family protein [Oligoflexus sp.]